MRGRSLRTRGGTRQGNYPPRSEAGKCQGHTTGTCKSAGLRVGESDLRTGAETGSDSFANTDCYRHGNHGGAHSWYAWIYEPRASTWTRSRSTNGHMGLRLPLV